MLMFWEGFWFVLSTLSNVNGTFIILSIVISSPWQRAIATIASSAIFRLIFNGKHVSEPMYIEIAAVAIHQSIVSSWGLKWGLMVVAFGLNALPFFTGYYLALRPGRPLYIGYGWWSVLIFISANIESVIMALYSCSRSQREVKDYAFCKLHQGWLGLLLIAHGLLFGCMHRQFKRQRRLRNMDARFMNAQIQGLTSSIPIGWRRVQFQ